MGPIKIKKIVYILYIFLIYGQEINYLTCLVRGWKREEGLVC